MFDGSATLRKKEQASHRRRSRRAGTERREMKNKFKKIIPLILCFVMILGSCLTVNAARISSDKGNVGDTFSFGVNIFVPYNNYYRSYLVSASITNASDEVRVTPMLYISDNDYFASTLLICSKKPFSIDYQADSIFNSKNAISYSEIVFDKTKSTDSNSVKYNGVTYYYLNVGSSSMLTGSADVEVLNLSASPIDPTFYDPNYDRSNFGLLLEKLYLADFTWDDGKSSVYDTQPTAEIEPPKICLFIVDILVQTNNINSKCSGMNLLTLI